MNPDAAGNVLLFTAEALLAVQFVQVPVRLVIVPDVGVPKTGVVNDMLVAVVALGRASTPALLTVIAALPLDVPYRVIPEAGASTISPNVPAFTLARVSPPAVVPATPNVGVAVAVGFVVEP